MGANSRTQHRYPKGVQPAQRMSPYCGDDPPLVIGLPNGSSNSTNQGRADTAAFLALGHVCPTGYAPGLRDHLPKLPGVEGLRFIVGRPQKMPQLASEGKIDAFIAFGDVLCEAEEAGVRGIELAIELPYAAIDVVVVTSRATRHSDLRDLLLYAPTPIDCISEMPYLARKALFDNEGYRQRFGASPPAIELHGTTIADGCQSVLISMSPGTSEPLVSEGFYECAVVVRSTGRTIDECKLRVIETVGTYRPGFYYRRGVREDPVLAPKLDWFVQRLQTATGRWCELQRRAQLELWLPVA